MLARGMKGVDSNRLTDIQTRRLAGLQTRRLAELQTYRLADSQNYRHTDSQTRRTTDTRRLQSPTRKRTMCCCCESKKGNAAKYRGNSKSGGVRACFALVNPLNVLFNNFKKELEVNEIPPPKFSARSLEFADKGMESEFTNQWRFGMEKNLVWFCVLILAIMIAKAFAIVTYFDAENRVSILILHSVLAILPFVLLLLATTVRPTVLHAYYDQIVGSTLVCVSLSVSIVNFLTQTISTLPLNGPDCRLLFPSPYVKAIIWFGAIGLRVKFVSSFFLGIILCVTEIVVLQVGLRELGSAMGLLGNVYGLGVSLLYASFVAYQSEIACRRNFLLARGAWKDPNKKKDMIKQIVHPWTERFLDDSTNEEFIVFERLKQSRVMQWKPITSLFTFMMIFVLYTSVRLPSFTEDEMAVFQLTRDYSSISNNTFVEIKTGGYVSSKGIYVENAQPILYIHIPVAILVSIMAVAVLHKCPHTYKEDPCKSRIYGTLLLWLVPVVISAVWLAVIQVEWETGQNEIDALLPLNKNYSKTFTIPEWNNMLIAISRKHPDDTGVWYDIICDMTGRLVSHRCNLRVFEMLQTFCPGAASLTNYVVWVVQIQCILMTSRKIPAFFGIFVVALIYWGLAFYYGDVDMLGLLFRDAPLFLCALIVKANMHNINMEHFIALKFNKPDKYKRKLSRAVSHLRREKSRLSTIVIQAQTNRERAKEARSLEVATV